MLLPLECPARTQAGCLNSWWQAPVCALCAITHITAAGDWQFEVRRCSWQDLPKTCVNYRAVPVMACFPAILVMDQAIT